MGGWASAVAAASLPSPAGACPQANEHSAAVPGERSAVPFADDHSCQEGRPPRCQVAAVTPERQLDLGFEAGALNKKDSKRACSPSTALGTPLHCQVWPWHLIVLGRAQSILPDKLVMARLGAQNSPPPKGHLHRAHVFSAFCHNIVHVVFPSSFFLFWRAEGLSVITKQHLHHSSCRVSFFCCSIILFSNNKTDFFSSFLAT